MKRIFIFGVIAGVLLTFCIASAQGQTVSSISGTVVDSYDHHPLQGVTVYLFAYIQQPQNINGRPVMLIINPITILDSHNRWLDAGPVLKTTATDTNGKFLFQDLGAGKYRLDLDSGGYEFLRAPRIMTVHRNEMVNLSATFEMRPMSLVIDTYLTRSPCGSLVQPGQTADVYVVCADSR